jgi:hypothetical protein
MVKDALLLLEKGSELDTSVGRASLDLATLGLKVPCSTR